MGRKRERERSRRVEVDDGWTTVCWKKYSCFVRIQEDNCEWSPPRSHLQSDSDSEDDSISKFMGNEGENKEEEEADVVLVEDSAKVLEPEINRCIGTEEKAGSNNREDASVNLEKLENKSAKVVEMGDDASSSGNFSLNWHVQDNSINLKAGVDSEQHLGSFADGPSGPRRSSDFKLGGEKTYAVHDGSGSDPLNESKEIPDLNESPCPSISVNLESTSISNSNRLFSKKGKMVLKQGALSMKLKDVIRNSSKGRQKAKRRLENLSTSMNCRVTPVRVIP
ncbi:hypothetical protein L2E82_48613 [Cichorium intybus]|uniref:Uncharacterized protein n=1 Tax=Cichorium intybus TaxID=13427 RepID=A0ACB8Z2P7_CICIN|nr:hypothetical protein L2E82_48613 [Cichorium intybus]